MERLTDKAWRNLDPWECCGQDHYCQRDCHGEGGCNNGCIVPKIYCKLAKYEDAEERGTLVNFKEGEYIIYQNGDRYELGRIKRITSDGAFVWYHAGDTAAKTPFDCMNKLANAYTIQKASLGGRHE